MAQILYANGEVRNVEPRKGNTFSLEELQKIVGGFIELVRLNALQYMVVNDEGLIRNLPYNALATEAFNLAFQPKKGLVVGDVLICDVNQIE